MQQQQNSSLAPVLLLAFPVVACVLCPDGENGGVRFDTTLSRTLALSGILIGWSARM